LIAEDAMKTSTALGTLFALGILTGAVVAESKKPPDVMTFEAKNGPVTFDHKKHSERVKDDCKACHVGVFPEEKSPLNYKESMHKKAEGEKTSCAACHVAGGTAFESKGHCQGCHVKKPA
jgi:c(7)-type cytochrome triheme protein